MDTNQGEAIWGNSEMVEGRHSAKEQLTSEGQENIGQ